jgi:polyisoprenoid-binding protein YceI
MQPERTPPRGGGATASEQGGIITFVAVVALIVLAGAAAFWWFVVRSDAAPEPEIKGTNVVAGGTLGGTWKIEPHLGSFVQYRVKQQLVGALESDATGRTESVTGTLEIDDSTVSDVTVTANLKTLESDKVRRDEKLRTDGLQSDQFPTSTFVLTDPIDLGAVPPKGKTVRADATGDFTLHGITKRVTLPLQGRWDGEAVQVVGKLPIQFADYGITPPNIGGFVTVADQGRMEFRLVFIKP